MAEFTFDYLVLTTSSSFGVLLFATGRRHLRGLLLFNPGFSQVVGWVIVVAAFVWFFTSTYRNVPDTGAGLDGNQQAFLFSAGAILALILLLLLSLARNWRMRTQEPSHSIDDLYHSNYLKLIERDLEDRWKSFYRRIKKHSSG